MVTVSSTQATARMRAELKTARHGWLRVECRDQIKAAWDYVLERRDELVAVDRNCKRVA
jgi:hypothetical protein